jgi:hypothetical protein
MEVLEGNMIYVLFKNFIFPNRTVLVRLYRQINIHLATEYAASSNTAMPPYPLIQYLRFQLSAVYRGLGKIGKLKK